MIFDLPIALTMRAILVGGPFHALAHPLPADLDQTKLADPAPLHPGPVLAEFLSKHPLHLPTVLSHHHVDEVTDNQPPQVSEPELARDLAGRRQVGLKDGAVLVAFGAHL